MFRDMEVTAELDDQVITKTRGTMMMNGTPLNGLIWLAQALKKEGIALKKGDLLSVGSFAAGQTPRLGTMVKVTYRGVPGNPAISVAFSERMEN